MAPNVPSDLSHSSNPFISRKARPEMSSDAASITALREAMTRMNIVDGGCGEFAPCSDKASSKDKGGSKRDLDRFVPSRRGSSLNTSTISSLDEADTSKRADQSSSSLPAALGLASGRRILSFNAAPPAPSHATSHLDAQRNYLLTSSATANRGTSSAGPAAQQVKKRIPPYTPTSVLDAPEFADDYYLNLLDWGSSNCVAIGLGTSTYVWSADTGAVDALTPDNVDDEIPVCSVTWSSDGAYLAVGNDEGQIVIWDVEEQKRIRTMNGHNVRVSSLSWNGHLLSSGCRDGAIFNHDVRIAQHKVSELQGHSAEVCGLKWRADGQLLASGGNDNVVNCWDSRTHHSVTAATGRPMLPKFTKRNHTAAVKALAWCPWQPSILATGGGSADQTIHFWNASTGARTASLHTGSQVTSIIWSPHAKELLSTHGYPNNNISLWSYPSLTKIYDIQAHESRVLATAISPDGLSVASAAADENLKFWRIWEPKATKKAVDHDRDARGQSRVRIR